jgi:hypothetical protein
MQSIQPSTDTVKAPKQNQLFMAGPCQEMICSCGGRCLTLPWVDSGDTSCHLFPIMQALKVEVTVEKEGELHLTNLPLHPAQRVEVIVLIREETQSTSPSCPTPVGEDEWRRLVDLIRSSDPRFPTLDEAMRASRGRL